MAVARYLNFDFNFFDKYTTRHYYLSKGASGNVYGPIQWNRSQLAIKQALFADDKVTDKFKKDIEVKKDIWMSLEHKHLMRIHSVDLKQLPKVMYIVMDFAVGGSLNKTLRSLGSENKLPIEVVTNWAKQIAEGMLYLHDQRIVHRDLKSSNILLMEPFDIRNSHTSVTMKIADFDEVKEHDHTATMSTLVGTCAYMAPEVLRHQWFSKASDVWSYGVVIWEMLSGDIPHKGLELTTIMAKSQAGKLDNLPLKQSFPEDYKLLLKKCWEPTSRKRTSFNEIFDVLQRMVSEEAAAENDDSITGELPDKYKSDPDLIETIRIMATEEGMKSIRGLTIIEKELFLVSARSSTVEIYDSITLSFSRQWNLEQLVDPIDIGSCKRNKCLYIFGAKHNMQQSREILRVDPSGKLMHKWSTGDVYGWSLSVTDESNVILTVRLTNKLNEYSPDGRLIRTIDLSSEVGILSPFHCLKLANGHFLVSHGTYGDNLHRVCIVDAGGKLMKSFGGKRGSKIGQMSEPVYMSVDENGFVLVVDQGNRRVLLLDSDLEFKREILSKSQNQLRDPAKILLDESSGRLFVADNSCNSHPELLIFDVKRQ